MRGSIVPDASAAMVRSFAGTATEATLTAAIGVAGGAFATEVSRWAFSSAMPISGNRRLMVVGSGQARSAELLDCDLKLGIGGRKGKTEYVARLVCEEIYGSAPLLHEAAHATRSGCIGGLCVAPHHLRWATSRENSQDIPPEVRTEASRKGAVTAGKRMYNLPRNVSFDQRNKKYKVVCKEKFVGYYYTIDEAVAARDKYLGVN